MKNQKLKLDLVFANTFSSKAKEAYKNMESFYPKELSVKDFLDSVSARITTIPTSVPVIVLFISYPQDNYVYDTPEFYKEFYKHNPVIDSHDIPRILSVLKYNEKTTFIHSKDGGFVSEELNILLEKALSEGKLLYIVHPSYKVELHMGDAYVGKMSETTPPIVEEVKAEEKSDLLEQVLNVNMVDPCNNLSISDRDIGRLLNKKMNDRVSLKLTVKEFFDLVEVVTPNSKPTPMDTETPYKRKVVVMLSHDKSSSNPIPDPSYYDVILLNNQVHDVSDIKSIEMDIFNNNETVFIYSKDSIHGEFLDIIYRCLSMGDSVYIVDPHNTLSILLPRVNEEKVHMRRRGNRTGSKLNISYEGVMGIPSSSKTKEILKDIKEFPMKGFIEESSALTGVQKKMANNLSKRYINKIITTLDEGEDKVLLRFVTDDYDVVRLIYKDGKYQFTSGNSSDLYWSGVKSFDHLSEALLHILFIKFDMIDM